MQICPQCHNDEPGTIQTVSEPVKEMRGGARGGRIVLIGWHCLKCDTVTYRATSGDRT